MDLKAGYWQLPVKEEDKPKTAFTVGPLGFWELNSLPFGAVNAPACFQRLMLAAMGDLHLRECLLYIDNIIIFNRTFDEHISRLEAVFERLHKAKLKLKASKCFFIKDQIKYLLGPFCYKLITIVNCYLETGLTCFVYCPKALYLIIFIVWHPF